MNQTVDLRRLHVLRMIHAHGTVTAAAEALHLTPSAVSHQMRQLSRELGVALLEPDGRRVRLTPAGDRLVAHADELHAGWERATADLAAVADGRAGLLRLCAPPSTVAAVLTPAAQVLARSAPGLEVRITELEEATEGFDLLLAGEADIALVTSLSGGPPLDDPRYEQQPLLAEPLDLLVAADHPLADLRTVALEAVATEPWVLAAPGSWDCRQMVASACAVAGFSPRVVHEASSPMAVAALVGAGFGVAVVPRLVPLPAHSDVRRVPLEGDPPPQRRLLTCVRRGSGHQPAIARGLEALREVARALPPPLLPTATGLAPSHEDEHLPHRHAG